MEIREAVADDNNALQELQYRCPQGTDLIASVVNTPDFFSRAKAYELYKVFIAHEGNQILGSTACGFRNAIVNGEVERVGYGFQAFVSPDHRRKGVASKLHQHREEYAKQQGASLFYTLVMEKNTPAMRYIEHRGFQLHRTVVMPGLSIYKKMEMPSSWYIRSAHSNDLTTLADLLNQTWYNYEMYEPISGEGLSQVISRTPGFNIENLLVLEEGGKISAFIGYIDWGQIMQITIESISLKMRMMGLMLKIVGIFRSMPKFVKPGDTLKQIMIAFAGFKEPNHFILLLKYLNNKLLPQGIEQIFCICEKNHAILESMKGFIRIDTDINLYVKSLIGNGLNPDNPLFINGIDM